MQSQRCFAPDTEVSRAAATRSDLLGKEPIQIACLAHNRFHRRGADLCGLISPALGWRMVACPTACGVWQGTG